MTCKATPGRTLSRKSTVNMSTFSIAPSVWTARQGTSSPMLAKAVYKQVAAELNFARKIAIEEKASKTTVVIDALLVTRNERLDKLSKTMLEEKRKLRKAEAETSRTRTRR